MQTMYVRSTTKDDAAWVKEIMDSKWGGEPLVIRNGKKYYPSMMDGLIAESKDGKEGFLFYEIQQTTCEIIVFEVFNKYKGTGTLLLNQLKQLAKDKHCDRILLMTTNDNIDSLRFYQRRGFTICAIRLNAVATSRKLKPTISYEGDYGIPLRDEIDLECFL